MYRPSLCFAFLLMSLLSIGLPRTSSALDLWPFQSPNVKTLVEAERAVNLGDYRRALHLVGELELKSTDDRARRSLVIGQAQRGLGALEKAVKAFEEAATLAPISRGRLEQSEALVALGRWPEAVAVLGVAFSESPLEVERVERDRRFLALKGFEPFETLMTQKKYDEAGPLSRVLQRVDSLEDAARALEANVQQLANFVRGATAFLASPMSKIIAFIFLATLAAAASRVVSSMPQVMAMLVGAVSASMVISMSLRSLSSGQIHGERTLLYGNAAWLGFGFAAFLLELGARRLRRYRFAKKEGGLWFLALLKALKDGEKRVMEGRGDRLKEDIQQRFFTEGRGVEGDIPSSEALSISKTPEA